MRVRVRVWSWGVVERRQREIRDGDEDGTASTSLDLRRVDSQKDGLEAGKGGSGAVTGDDARQIQTRDERDEGERDEAEIQIGGLKGVVEPLAERVVASAGGWVG